MADSQSATTAAKSDYITPLEWAIDRGEISIDLSGREINDQAAKAVAGLLRKHESLEELHLEHNQIGDDGAVHLAETLKGKQSLRCLHLGDGQISNNQTSDTGRKVLSMFSGGS